MEESQAACTLERRARKKERKNEMVKVRVQGLERFKGSKRDR